jgi:hypothetical protein
MFVFADDLLQCQITYFILFFFSFLKQNTSKSAASYREGRVT